MQQLLLSCCLYPGNLVPKHDSPPFILPLPYPYPNFQRIMTEMDQAQAEQDLLDDAHDFGGPSGDTINEDELLGDEWVLSFFSGKNVTFQPIVSRKWPWVLVNVIRSILTHLPYRNNQISSFFIKNELVSRKNPSPTMVERRESVQDDDVDLYDEAVAPSLNISDDVGFCTFICTIIGLFYNKKSCRIEGRAAICSSRPSKPFSSSSIRERAPRPWWRLPVPRAAALTLESRFF